MSKAPLILQCPLCSRLTRFARITEFIDHCWTKHEDTMSSEVNTRQVEMLNAGLERRQQRDLELSQVKDKLVVNGGQ